MKFIKIIIALLLLVGTASAASYSQSGGTATLYGNLTYDYFNLSNGAVVNIAAYNGTSNTGYLNLSIVYDVNINNSTINGDKKGYLGGTPSGYGGIAGTGAGHGTNGGFDGAYGQGGGCGGSSGYGTAGGACGGYFPGSPGSTYGMTNDYNISMGSGAGSGGAGNPCCGVVTSSPQAGEPGGGMLRITARNITISGNLTMDGGDGGIGGTTTYGYNGVQGGGGSGGGILLNASNINITNITVTTTSGTGGALGGKGRFKVFYLNSFVNNSTNINSGTEYYEDTGNQQPTIIHPTNNSYQNNQTMNFTWSITGAINFTKIYNWQVSKVSNFASIYLQGNTTNATFVNLSNNLTANNVYYIRVNTNISKTISDWSNTVNFNQVPMNISAVSPANGSEVTGSTFLKLGWSEWNQSTLYTYYLSTSPTFASNISSGTEVVVNYALRNSSDIQLQKGTKYYWIVKNSTGFYSDIFWFNTSSASTTPGRFNISVWDEVNTSKKIMNYSIQLYNNSNIVVKNSNTTSGWTNFSIEISDGEFLIIVIPNGTYSNYQQRMILADSPGNVTMYVPNSTGLNVTMNNILFSILDVTGLFSYSTSTISIYKGDYLLDKSYFSADGTHNVNLIQGNKYSILIQNENNAFYSNYIPFTYPYVSGTAQITINNFMPNVTQLNSFIFNITHNINAVTLIWNSSYNSMLSLNFTVRKGMPMVEQCQQTTNISTGIMPCGIDNTTTYHIIFSATMADGTFRNQSFFIDYSSGVIKSSTGTNPIDGSPMGIGFKWDYGTFTMPQWVYNWVSLLLILLLAGSFGARFSGIGAMLVGVVMYGLEYVGWFAPVSGTDPITNTPYQTIVMGLTVGLIFFSILYFMQHKERGG